jgi:hypothetical protein
MQSAALTGPRALSTTCSCGLAYDCCTRACTDGPAKPPGSPTRGTSLEVLRGANCVQAGVHRMHIASSKQDWAGTVPSQP